MNGVLQVEATKKPQVEAELNKLAELAVDIETMFLEISNRISPVLSLSTPVNKDTDDKNPRQSLCSLAERIQSIYNSLESTLYSMRITNTRIEL